MLGRANEHRKEASAAATTAVHAPVRRSPCACMCVCSSWQHLSCLPDSPCC